MAEPVPEALKLSVRETVDDFAAGFPKISFPWSMTSYGLYLKNWSIFLESIDLMSKHYLLVYRELLVD